MTVSSTSNKVAFSGSGTTGPFPFTFKVFSSADLTVTLTDASDVETTLTITSQYTVSLNADQNNNPGGSVTTISAVASGYSLTIVREVDALQETDIANGGGFYPEVIENALDLLSMVDQQQDEQLSRTLQLPVSDTASTALPSATDRANKYLGFDASGNPTVLQGTFAPITAPETKTVGNVATTTLATVGAMVLNNDNQTNGSAVGLGFSVGGSSNRKGAIFWKRTASYGRGEFHFCNEYTATTADADLANSVANISPGGTFRTNGGVWAWQTTVTPAGGQAAIGVAMGTSSNFGVFFGSGVPTLSALKGSLYLRTDGTTTNDRVYVNTDGGTTWTALITAA